MCLENQRSLILSHKLMVRCRSLVLLPQDYFPLDQYLRMRQRLIVAMGFLFMAVMTAGAGTYYVSPTGNDTYAGTSKNPFRTIQRGLNAASKGTSSIPDNVQVRPGTYITEPVILYYDHVRLVFEDGVEVVARSLSDPAEPNDPENPLSFAHPGATLFTLQDRQDITIEGSEHTVFRMNPEEYPLGQFRHTIKLTGCKNITIRCFDMLDSGGDGIYIGRTSSTNLDCSGILISDIRCIRNRRNGLTIASVDGLEVQDCIFAQTAGEQPQSGIDMEPNTSEDQLANILIKRCRIEDNANYGLVISCRNLTDASTPLSVDIEQCYFSGSRGIDIVNFFDDCPMCPKGYVTVQACTIENALTGIVLHKDAFDDFQVVFDRCVIKDIYDPQRWPIQINTYVSGNQAFGRPGGVTFLDCQVIDNFPRYALKVNGSNPSQVFDIHGDLYVENEDTTAPWPPHNINPILADNGVDITFHQGYAPAIRVYNSRLWSWYSTITNAISESCSGDRLDVTPTEFRENINFTQKNVAVVGYDPAPFGNSKQSVLIGNENPNTVFFYLNDDRARLEHMIIKKGIFGIRCVGGSPQVKSCQFTECSDGIYCSHQSKLSVQESVIWNNYDNGIKCYDSSAQFVNNLIFGNEDAGCKFKNAAGSVFRNNTVYGGTYGIIGEDSGLPEIRNSIIWGTTNKAVLGAFSVNHCCTKDRVEGHGNIQADPLFANQGEGNYFLRSSYGRWYPAIGLWVLDTETSPCIDAGAPGDPMDDELYPNGRRINMGAYGGTWMASKSGPKFEGSDLNSDNCVNSKDLEILSRHWLDSCDLQ